MQKTVAVVFGGVSNENEISVITGTMAANVLKSGGYEVIPIYISPDGVFYSDEGLCDITNFKSNGFARFPSAILANGGVYTLKKNGKFKKFQKVDVALNCCHGGYGEGGGICGLCAAARIPLASAGIAESSVFMDKYLTKLALSSLGVPVLPYAVVRDISELSSAKLPPFPVIVKPVALGSSIGVEKAGNAEELERAVYAALTYDGAVLVESYLKERREINVAACFIGGKIRLSECEEAVTKNDVLSFEDKYQGSGKSVCPADIPPDMSQLIKSIAERVYLGLNIRGIVRFDFLLCGDKVYLSEVNTVPGSLSYYLLSSGFKDFLNVLKGVIEQAESDFKLAASKKILHTGILENVVPLSYKSGAKL